MQCKSDGQMEDLATKDGFTVPPVVDDSQKVKNTESAENFQKFMYELFEKNGVINDLRAYLRGHIVGLLRSSRNGDPPACQKHFTQRLELPYQAINMLIAEYLLKMEFSYTLSVFISEIPLANMVFQFAKTLMQGVQSDQKLQFKDEDVWTMLNYLGVKCDSSHATSISEMYSAEKQLPLLMCIITCMPLHKEPVYLDHASQDRVSEGICASCRGNMVRIKDKNNKDRTRAQMFDQLQSVYEAEMRIVKTEEDKRIQRTLANHALQFQKKRAELEESFRARELQLERNVQQKKRFLWGLARLLREQHQQMDKAMQDIQEETNRLSAKEENLKVQLAEAEQFLRKRGEDMRRLISQELAILEGHLDSMKKERDAINKERIELERMKHLSDDTAQTTNIETTKEDLRTHYDLLKDEFNILKVYLKSAKVEPKCVIDRSTLTDALDDSTVFDAVLNNGQDLDRGRSDDKIKAKQVVNDLKKMKNVNFSQSNLERGRTSHASSETDEIKRLTEENERLRNFATQQGEHIDSLSSQVARLDAELAAARLSRPPTPTPRPRTAPPLTNTLRNNDNYFVNGTMLSNNANSAEVSRGYGWRKGAGQEMSFFANAQPRIIVPGDAIPFIGVLDTRRHDSRRYLINQWRSLRRRMSPIGGVGKSRLNASGTSDRSDINKDDTETAHCAAASGSKPAQDEPANHCNSETASKHSYKSTRDKHVQKQRSPERSTKERDKSPKLILRDAKDKMKSKEYNARRSSSGRHSPNTVLRDARMRLRKLEIEAEAVEKSYMHFKKKQDALKHERFETKVEVGEHSGVKAADIKFQNKPVKSKETYIKGSSYYPTAAVERIIEDIDEYRATHFKNKNFTPVKVNPIPTAFSYETPQETKRNLNYLETPLTEFRKYYHSENKNTSERLFEDRLRTSPQEEEDPQIPRTPYLRKASDYLPRHVSPSNRNRKCKDSRSTNPKSESIIEIEQKLPEIRDNCNDPPSLTSLDVNDRPQTPKDENFAKDKGNEMEADPSKARELEILKQNISKIYNLSEQTVADNCAEFNNIVLNAKRNMEKDERKMSVIDTITEASRDEISEDSSKMSIEDNESKLRIGDNLLRIELQSVTQVSDVKIDTQPQDLVLVVESSIHTENSETDLNHDGSVQMTMNILVSPKKSDPIKSEENLSTADNSNAGEKSAKIENEFDSLYKANAGENFSSSELKLDNSKEALGPFPSLSNLKASEDPDYPDDLEVSGSNKYDSDIEHSAISMPKTSEDDNFWDN